MKILILDDKEHHRNAAREQLSGHDLTILSDYDQAIKLIQSERDWDIVLTDLLLPASSEAQYGEGREQVGKEMSVGTLIVLTALIVGVKKIGLLTDKNHHHHPASASLDHLAGDTPSLTGCKNGINRVGDAFLFVSQFSSLAAADKVKDWSEAVENLKKASVQR